DDDSRSCALTPAEPKDVLSLGPERLGRHIVSNAKQPWMGAATVEGQEGHVELQATIFLARQQLLRQPTPVSPSRGHLGLDILEQVMPALVVDGAPIVRVD